MCVALANVFEPIKKVVKLQKEATENYILDLARVFVGIFICNSSFGPH